MNISIINPIDYRDWDELLLSNQDYSFFHSSHWAKVLCESYGYKPLYFVSIEDIKYPSNASNDLKRSAPYAMLSAPGSLRSASNLKHSSAPPTTNDFKHSAPYAMLSAPGSLRATSNLKHSSPPTSNEIFASTEKLMTCLPLMEVKSFLTGQRGVSLPFTDYCDPIVARDIHFMEVFEYLREYGKQAGWKFIEIRGGRSFPHDFPHSSYYYGHTLNLSRNEDQIFSNFRSSTKRNIKKAMKEGVGIHIENSLESIKEFYRLNCMTRKDHGLPPQPYYFFEKIFDHIISKNQGFVVLASYKEMIIAGAVYFHFGKKAIYKYGASDRRYLRLKPNNLVMWEAIKWYSQNGYENFSFGRTEPENKGLMQFKAAWGAEESVIRYYRYDLKKNIFVNGDSHVSGLHNKVFNKMPIPLLKVAGSLFYRHMG